MPDSAQRQAALDLRRSFCVRAPAGSGKTGLLINRMLVALADVERPEQVLAITFTRKAAAEIRQRLQEALDLAQAGQRPQHRFQAQVYDLARAVLQRSQQHGWRLEQDPNRIRATTIDGLNRDLARRLPVLSGLGAALDPIDDARELYRGALQRALEHAEEPDCPPELRLSIEACYRLGQNRLDQLLDQLAPLLGQREQWAGQLGRAADPEACLEHWTRLALEQADRSLASAPRQEWLSCLRALVAAGQDDWQTLADCQSWPSTGVANLGQWQQLANSLLSAKGEWRKPRGLTVKTGFPPGAATKQARVLLEEFAAHSASDCEARLAALAWLPTALDPEEPQTAGQLLRVLHLALAELRLLFAENQCCDHPELALAARQALTEDEAGAAAAADARYRHILVDEMQDTSSGQIELLRLLCQDWSSGDGRSLFLVGDPQQSIYAFRQARVEMFNALLQPGARLGSVSLQPLQLSQNFRSGAALIAYCNKTLGEAFNEHASPIAFAPSQAPEDAPTVSEVLCQDHGDAEAEAAALCEQLATLGGQEPEAKIGVLARNRGHLRALAAALRARSISFAGVELEQLATTPAVRDYLALLRLLHQPQDAIAWIRLLRCPAVGLAWADCDQLAVHLEGQTWARLAQCWAEAALSADGRMRCAHLFGHLIAVQLSFAEQGNLANAARSLHYRLGLRTALDPRQQRDIARLESHIQEHCIGGRLADEKAFLRSLERLYADTDAAAIELMTIHKSKGLEFDHVFLLGLSRGGRGGREDLLRFGQNEGGHCLAIKPPPTGTAVTASLYHWLARQQTELERAEQLRLLYVAMTRARRVLHLHFTGTTPRGSLGHYIADQRPERPSGVASSKAKAEARSVDHPYLPLDQTGRDTPAGLPQPQRLFGPNPSGLASPERPESHWDVERHAAALLGTSLHEALELLAERGIAHWAEQRDAMLRALGAGLARRGLAQARQPGLLDQIGTQLDRAVAGEAAHLLADWPWARNEYALSAYRQGQWQQAIIDRCFETPDGELWVVDYKTNQAPTDKRELAVWLQSLAARYRPQLQRYAELLSEIRQPRNGVRQALYIVGLDQVLELGPESAEAIPAPRLKNNFSAETS